MSPSAMCFHEAKPSPSALLDIGLCALRKFLHQDLPKNFWQVVGLSYLARTAVLVSEHHNTTDQFLGISADIQRLANTIEPIEDRIAFRDLAQEILPPEVQHNDMWIDDGSASLQGCGRLISCWRKSGDEFRLSPPLFLQPCDVLLQASNSNTRQEMQLIDSLRSGTVVGLCLHYLDCKSTTISPSWLSLTNAS